MPAGEHPNAMALSKDGQRLFVACGNSAAVWVFDTFSNEPIEQISTNLYPEAPPTSTPNSVALSPDGRTLLVANADNNAVAVVDVSNAARSIRRRLHPDRLVSDRRGVLARRQADSDHQRQRAVLGGEHAAAAGWRRG